MKKKILVAMIMTLSLSVLGCTPKHEEEPSSEGPTVIANKFIIEEGMSPYYVVTPKKALSKEITAAQEFTYFMKQSTNVDLPIINEKEVRRSYSYISLGMTKQFLEAYPDFNYSSIDNTVSSYFIGTKNDNIYIVSGDDYKGYGTLYGVYD